MGKKRRRSGRRRQRPPVAQANATPAKVPRGRQGAPDVIRSGRWNNRPTYARQLTTDCTPARIASAIRRADQGYPADLFIIWEQVLDRDPRIVSLLNTRAQAVTNAPWEVHPGGRTQRDRKIADDVTLMLQNLRGKEKSWRDLMQSITSGFAATEITWKYSGGKIIPVGLKYAPPRFFQPSPADPEVWNLRDQSDLVNGVPLRHNGWVTHMAGGKTGFPVQSGLARPLLWWWLFKHYGIKDWAAYSELFGSPFRLGTFKQSASPETIDALGDALDALGVNAYAVVPDSVKIDFVGDNSFRSGPDVYQKLIDYCDRCLAIGILGQELTSSSGSGSGSYALGQVHNLVRDDIRRGDARELADSFTDGLIRAYVEMNHGADVPVPRFVFNVDPPKDKKKEADAQKARGEVYKLAISLGLSVSRAQMREDMHLLEPQSEDDTITGGGSVEEGNPAPEPENEDED